MAPLLISERDVESLLTLEEAIPVVEDAFLQQARASATNRPRTRVLAGPGSHIHFMDASADEPGVYGFKTYTIVDGSARYFVYLFSSETGELLAIVQARGLGRLRTGAATALAARYMAREEASTAGVLGSGYQSRTQLEGMCRVRPVSEAVVYSPTEANREAFAEEMTDRLGIPVTAVDGPQAAVEGADVLTVITKSKTPVLDGAWLSPGVHVTAAGGASPFVREFDETVLRRAGLIAVDDLAQAQIESGELMEAASDGHILWSRLRELWQVVGGEVAGRTGAEEITLFKSLGMALWDVVAAKAVYDKAAAAGAGTRVPSPLAGEGSSLLSHRGRGGKTENRQRWR